MKYVVALLCLGFTACATGNGPKGHVATDAHCLYLDNGTGWARCETEEVICYTSVGGQNCWPKPAPAPSAAPSPVAKPMTKKSSPPAAPKKK